MMPASYRGGYMMTFGHAVGFFLILRTGTHTHLGGGRRGNNFAEFDFDFKLSINNKSSALNYSKKI